MALPERLKQLRDEHKVSQTDVAKMLKITRQAYNNYERGIREPHQAIIRALASYFGVTIDYILGVSENPSVNVSEKEIENDLSNRLKLIFKILSESSKMKLLSYAQILFEHEYMQFDYENLFNDLYNGKITHDELNKIILKNKRT